MLQTRRLQPIQRTRPSLPRAIPLSGGVGGLLKLALLLALLLGVAGTVDPPAAKAAAPGQPAARHDAERSGAASSNAVLSRQPASSEASCGQPAADPGDLTEDPPDDDATVQALARTRLPLTRRLGLTRPHLAGAERPILPLVPPPRPRSS